MRFHKLSTPREVSVFYVEVFRNISQTYQKYIPNTQRKKRWYLRENTDKKQFRIQTLFTLNATENMSESGVSLAYFTYCMFNYFEKFRGKQLYKSVTLPKSHPIGVFFGGFC